MKFIYYFLSLLISSTALAQRSEINRAKAYMDQGEYYLAKKQLDKAESQISNKSQRLKSTFYYTKGMVYLGLNAGEVNSMDGFKKALDYFEKAKEYGGEKNAKEGLKAAEEVLISSTVMSQEKEDYESAYDKALLAHQINSQDTIYLYYAAKNAFLAGMDEKAIDLFKQLNTGGFKGNKKQYTAVSLANGQVDYFSDKRERDALVRVGSHEQPNEIRLTPVHGEVLKNLATLYKDSGQMEKAKQLFAAAKKERPKDYVIRMAEANFYKNIDEQEKYEDLLKQMVSENPENAVHYYLLMAEDALKEDDLKKAKNYYKEAIKADSSSLAAYKGLSGLILHEAEEKLKTRFNGMTDSEKTEENLKKLNDVKRQAYSDALPYLEKAHALDEDDLTLIEALYRLNLQLGDKKEAEKYRKKGVKIERQQ